MRRPLREISHREQNTMEHEASGVGHLLKSLPGYHILRRVYHFGATDEQWLRVVMNRQTRAIVSGLSPANLAALEISGTNWSKIPFRSYKSVHYPDFDICESHLADQFDLILADQVFEHLLWPYRAGKNVYKCSIQVAIFLSQRHFLSVYTIFLPTARVGRKQGSSYFLAECGFDIEHIRTGSWGNRTCVNANFSRWILYRPWLHSLKNEPLFPVAVWALAQK